MNNIILTATLIVAFFMCILAYLMGLKHGKQLGNGIVPKVELNLVKAITDSVEQHSKKTVEKKLEKELVDAMSYTKEYALEAIKKGR